MSEDNFLGVRSFIRSVVQIRCGFKLGWGTATHRWDASRMRLRIPTCCLSPDQCGDHRPTDALSRRNETASPVVQTCPEPNSLIMVLTDQVSTVKCKGRCWRSRGAGGRAGGAEEFRAHARACLTPRPKCCPISRSEVDSLSAPGQDQLLRGGVGPLFWL